MFRYAIKPLNVVVSNYIEIAYLYLSTYNT